ncbi:molybdenum cofactor guanylyltransferase MobA [Solimicrobium silvestre]|uniref:Molybdenum cofactor guanylyltransferase n=1 Tax=Solimicrobium silvestre TaxID=2099400 RepID=A0A2S9GX02_9BURK|nr:molybdenum cofactor guanylyltransferase MobA [Solimicrobium silvestre]PRC92228.1 Molybdopterin-guanine dinucleotide biosynthesis protein A [Solimicrobium silvestre]
MNSTIDSILSATTGLILAGGRATRMQNCDKGLQELDGERLIAHVITRLAPQVTSIAISANRNLDEYAKFGYPVWPDISPDFAGPLAGLESGLTYCQTPYLLTVPCDSPFLPTNLAQRLMNKLQHQQADIAIACTGELAHLQAQPVFCLLKASCLEQLQHYLAGGGRKMDGWYTELTVARVYFEDEAEFRNINTREELLACSNFKKA